MSKITFVVDFDDGDEPAVHAHMRIMGGEVVSVAFSDLNEKLEKLVAASEIRAAEYRKAGDVIGKWLSAALEDPMVCREFKADIEIFFDYLSGITSSAD